MRRWNLMSSLIVAIAIGCSVSASIAYGDDPPAAAGRPNFIVFIADDMSVDDCGAYGHPHIRTPNIDRLAREGMRFDNAFLTCSSCSPSRASILTGRYPHSTGAHQLHMPLPGSQVTMSELLTANGYYTAAAGKWHLGPATVRKFDTVRQEIDVWVETLRDRPRDRPFFMWFAFKDPHRPYREDTIEHPHTPDDVVVPPYLPDVAEVRADLALYYDEIARLDGVVGRVLDELARQGETERTMVVFLSDNGRPFPRCKTTVYDSGIETPWIVRFPDRVKPKSTCDALVSSIDLAPTVLALAGVKVPYTFQGRSFEPLLDDPGKSVREHVFAEHNWHDFEDHGRAVRSKRFKYIRNQYADVPGTPPADAVRSMTFQAMRKLRDQNVLTPPQSTCFQAPRPPEELYDVAADPHELNNLAADPQFAEELQALRRVLDEWERRTGDFVPEQRRADEFDRETGDRLPQFSRTRRRRIDSRN